MAKSNTSGCFANTIQNDRLYCFLKLSKRLTKTRLRNLTRVLQRTRFHIETEFSLIKAQRKPVFDVRHGTVPDDQMDAYGINVRS